MHHKEQAVHADLYYRALPSSLLWPMLVLATAASVVASQVRRWLAACATHGMPCHGSACAEGPHFRVSRHTVMV